MTKRTGVTVLCAAAAVLIAGVGGWWMLSRPESAAPSVTPAPDGGGQPTPSPAKAETWEDPAGFTFTYPSGIRIDKHDEDTENYAHVELTDPSHPGNLIVWASDTAAPDAAAWVTSDKRLKGAASIDSSLGTLSAKKAVLPKNGTQLVGTVTDGIVFYIEASAAGTFWPETFETVRSSFAFTDQQDVNAGKKASAPDTGAAAAGEEEAMEEETVE